MHEFMYVSCTFPPIVFQAQSQKLTNLRTWEKRKEKKKGRQTERDFMEETQCIWSTYPDWIPPGWESAVSVIHELYALCQAAPQSHPSPADKSGWAWQTVTNGLTPAPSLPAGPADNWVWHGKQSQPGPFSASKSCRQLGLTWKSHKLTTLPASPACGQVRRGKQSQSDLFSARKFCRQLGLTWKTVTNWPLLCQQVLHVVRSDMENVINWPLLCQQVLQIIGSDTENCDKLTPSLPDSHVWHGKQSQTDTFSASKYCRQSCLIWSTVTHGPLLCHSHVWRGKWSQTDTFYASKFCRQLGLTWKTVTSWHPCLEVPQTVRSDMENSHKLTSFLPASPADNWVWQGSHKWTPYLPASLTDN